ncbi:MAG: acylneuraminate cytidylyltransferase family protein [Emcibacter sp.]|nr:acylneuraminate cytidylyltransferase family protein [Emcibacter sp.]
MTTYAFIFARGGSKGLPRKNIKLLNGKPLIQYSIETAQQSSIINEVFVSTDDKEISDIASGLGATIIKRPEELASDNAPEWLAWRHAINWVTKHRGDFDTFVSLPPTSPLRSVGDIESAVIKLDTNKADICISITEAARSPYFNMVIKDKNDYVDLVIKSDADVTRRQDAPQSFDITTVVYATSPKYVMEKTRIFDGKVVSVDIPKERAVDIDDIYDFYLAEVILSHRSVR